MDKPSIAICVPTAVGWRSNSYGVDWKGEYRRYEILNLIQSMKQCKERERLELSIFDLGSSRVEEYEKMIRDAWDGKLVFNSERVKTFGGGVERKIVWVSYGHYKTIQQCSSDRIFITGMDFWLPEDFCAKFDEYVGPWKAWIPYALHVPDNRVVYDPDHPGVGWHTAPGVVGMLMADYDKMGRYEYIKRVKSGADTMFYHRLVKLGFEITKKNCPGFLHIDHPGTGGGRTRWGKRNWPDQLKAEGREEEYAKQLEALKKQSRQIRKQRRERAEKKRKEARK